MSSVFCWLPWLLLAPQLAVVRVFFFWPAGQALWQSLLQQDAFGTSVAISGDTIVVGRKPTGTLLCDYLLPGKNLYLMSTGTGLAPFMSVIRDPDTYERFEKVILVHGVRQVNELAYHDYITQELPAHEFLGEMVSQQLLYYPTVTREPYKNQGRLTDLIENGKLFADLGMPPLNPETDRVMICGSPGMLKDLKRICEERGLVEGNTSTPGAFVIERAFAEA